MRATGRLRASLPGRCRQRAGVVSARASGWRCVRDMPATSRRTVAWHRRGAPRRGTAESVSRRCTPHPARPHRRVLAAPSAPSPAAGLGGVDAFERVPGHGLGVWERSCARHEALEPWGGPDAAGRQRGRMIGLPDCRARRPCGCSSRGEAVRWGHPQRGLRRYGCDGCGVCMACGAYCTDAPAPGSTRSGAADGVSCIRTPLVARLSADGARDGHHG